MTYKYTDNDLLEQWNKFKSIPVIEYENSIKQFNREEVAGLSKVV